MEMVEGSGGGGGSGGAEYRLVQGSGYNNEDILFCVDVDSESLSEMKNTGPNGRPITRLDSMKQSILLFMHAKLTINPLHRFAFASLSNSASWVRKEFSSDVDSAIAAFRSLSVTSPSSSSSVADLTHLFRLAAHQAKKSRSNYRILRVILLYCRSSVQPQFQWPANQKLFTLDVVYLHDKPGPENCPQKVYDALVEALEHVTEYEGYIFESGQGLQRILFRHMCLLLSHPQQRCIQDDLGLPMSLSKKMLATDAAQGQDTITH
ncbi:BRISC and BRCA1-A complex member 1 [Bienertia sinuspersici]